MTNGDPWGMAKRRGVPKGFKKRSNPGVGGRKPPKEINVGNRYRHSYLSLHPDPLPGVETPKDDATEAPKD